MPPGPGGGGGRGGGGGQGGGGARRDARAPNVREGSEDVRKFLPEEAKLR